MVQRRNENAWIHLNRPPVNSINPAVAHSLTRAVCQAIADNAIDGIVIAGLGQYFSFGADLPFFLRQAKAGDVVRIEQFAAQLHQLGQAIDRSEKPVVAAVHSVALGAGFEVALTCHRIITTRRATVGLPETGLCVCPGGGGTQRLPRRIGPALAKWMIFTGQFLSGSDAEQVGVIDKCVSEDQLQVSVEAEIASLHRNDTFERSSASIAKSYRGLVSTFDQHSVLELLRFAEDSPADWDGRTRRAVRSMASRSQRILLLAERLIDEGLSFPLNAALGLELAAIREMFDAEEVVPALQAAVNKTNAS